MRVDNGGLFSATLVDVHALLLRELLFPLLDPAATGVSGEAGLFGQGRCLFSAPPGVVLSLRERKYPKRSLRDRKL